MDSKVILVGAGPGDPELISVKGLKAIQQADCILYDALIDNKLLNFAPENCEKIYVGKRVGNCKFQQEEINEIIYQATLKHKNVIRLKGGDPFVFGRGYEELIYLQEKGVQVEIIPGISSAIAVPELEHIPLTTRGINESFWVITGTTSSLEFSNDLYHAARSTATVVILMGMTKLNEICKVFIEAEKADLPAVIIQNGASENKKLAFGFVHNISEIAKEKEMGSPSIIIFGKVAALHPDFK